MCMQCAKLYGYMNNIDLGLYGLLYFSYCDSIFSLFNTILKSNRHYVLFIFLIGALLNLITSTVL